MSDENVMVAIHAYTRWAVRLVVYLGGLCPVMGLSVLEKLAYGAPPELNNRGF